MCMREESWGGSHGNSLPDGAVSRSSARRCRSQRLAEFAAQQTKGLLLIRLEESWKTGASDRRRWSSALAADARLATFLENSVAQAPSLVEISIAGDDNRILVSSTR